MDDDWKSDEPDEGPPAAPEPWAVAAPSTAASDTAAVPYPSRMVTRGPFAPPPPPPAPPTTTPPRPPAPRVQRVARTAAARDRHPDPWSGTWTGPASARPDGATAGTVASGQRSGRIPGLDGLRALAVVAVVVYHVRPSWLPGGFLGVDVFFVVSGFLITTLLLRELGRSGRLSLPAFWLRRARRLLPALGVVVVTSIVAARVIEPDLLVGIGRQTLGAATFSSNWLQIAAGNSYFDRTAPEMFMTFWSLAIEEQFYVLWPLVLALLLAVTRSGRLRARLALVVALASAVWMAVLFVPGSDPTRVYYGTDTHLFGLLLGVAAAFAWTARPRLLTGRALAVVPPVAVAGLVGLMLVLHDDADVAYRGGILLGSLLALAAVAGCTGGATRFTRALDARLAAWVGERSYGIYLWHWPLLLLVGAALPAAPGTARWWVGSVLAVALTFVAAWASYRWVETPVRRDGFVAVAHRAVAAVRRPGARLVPALAGVSALVVVGAGLSVATAPHVSGAQASVEKGLDALAGAGLKPAGSGLPTPHAAQPSKRPASAPGAAAPGPQATQSPTTRTLAPADDLPPLLVGGAGGTGGPGGGPGTAKGGKQGKAGSVDGNVVVGFGDSVLSGAAPAMISHFHGITLDAKPIRKWVDAPAVVQAAADEDALRPYVVLNFGTNGGFQFDGSKAALEKVLDILGPDRRVVLVNTVGVSYWVPDANKELAAVAAKHPNVVVADWNAAVRGKPGLLHADHTHPNMQGIDVYADVVDAALRRAAGL